LFKTTEIKKGQEEKIFEGDLVSVLEDIDKINIGGATAGYFAFMV
jgi:hypothetical protein